MVLRINIVEASATLAERELLASYMRNHKELSKQEVNKIIYEDRGDGTGYTPNAQEIFNELYDEYFELLENCEHAKD